MGEIVIKKAVEREKGYLYYIDGEGNVCRAEMAARKKQREKAEKNPSKE